MVISSRQNPKIKSVAKLKTKKRRDVEQKFIIEGFYPLTFAVRNKYPIEELFICQNLFKEKFNNAALINKIRALDVSVTEVDEGVFQKISSSDSFEGLLAVAPQKHIYLKRHRPVDNGLYAVIESIEKLSSLGAIFRLADNVGASGVVVTNMRADIFNPYIMRNSLGAFFSIRILESTTAEAVKWFKRNKIRILATSPGATKSYIDEDMAGSVAVVLGTEYAGLSSIWLKKADAKIKIPMLGQTNSLSVTASAAVVLYEVLRQRVA